MRPILIVSLALAACVAQPAADQATTSAAPAEIDPSGTWRRTDPANGTLDVARDGANWRLTVLAAGLPAGAGTAADCELVAVGPLTGDSITGRLVPFEGRLGDISAEEIGPEPGRIEVSFAGDVATLSESDASGKHCGLGSDLAGTYRREG